MKRRINDMDAFEFVLYYPAFISELKEIVNPNLLPLLEKLEKTDPHDLVTPETCFVSPNHARGYVLSLFLKLCKENKKTAQ